MGNLIIISLPSQMVNEECNTGLGGVAHCLINSKSWYRNDYTLIVKYEGNTGDKLPETSRKITVHVI
jgi:hypothetical protein